jgi:GT2 family glycosyltransferase
VGVCIPTYEQAHLLRHAVVSAFTQAYDGPLDVWVSDDASGDDTADVLAQLLREFPALHVVRQPVNLGIAANASSVLRQAHAEFLVRLDSDDELRPGYVDRLARALALDSRAGYAHTQVLEIDEQGRAIRTRYLNRGSGFQDSETALRAALRGYRTAANILMFRRAALERVGFYDDRLTRVADQDLAIRMADAGYGNVYVAETLASYRVWSYASGERAGRKRGELAAYRHLFDETLASAWNRRGWNPRELTRQRNRVAARQCASCFSSLCPPGESEELVALLLQVGDGPGVRARVRLCRWGLAPLVGRWARLPERAKRPVKTVLARLRRLGRKPHRLGLP